MTTKKKSCSVYLETLEARIVASLLSAVKIIIKGSKQMDIHSKKE